MSVAGRRIAVAAAAIAVVTGGVALARHRPLLALVPWAMAATAAALLAGSRRVDRSARRAASAFARHSLLIAACAFAVLPIAWVVKMALSRTQGFSMSLSPLPDDPTLDNFARFLGHADSLGNWLFGRNLLNSVVVSVASTIIGVSLSTTAAYAFSRFRFPGRRAGLIAVLATQMFPGTMMMIPLYVLMNRLGLLDSLFGLMLVYATTAVPFCTWMLKGYFDTIPRELEEAAIIDGASPVRVFWSVILPLARPAIAVTALFSFLGAWNEFILAAKFLDTEARYTLPVVLYSTVGSKSVAWGEFAAGALVVSAPIVAVFFGLQRHLVSGLTAGGVKG